MNKKTHIEIHFLDNQNSLVIKEVDYTTSNGDFLIVKAKEKTEEYQIRLSSIKYYSQKNYQISPE
jgi:hypothetical protein